MEITMALPHTGKLASPETISRVAEEAERMGCATVWVLERLLRPTGGSMPDHYATVYDPLETLSYVAAKTERVKLGTSIIDALFPVPATLARRFATLDRLSGGRVIAGLGQGYAPEEFAAANVPMSRRGAGFEEFIRAMRAAWGADPVSFSGRFYNIPESEINPKPLQDGGPPIIIAAMKETAVERAPRLRGESASPELGGTREGAGLLPGRCPRRRPRPGRAPDHRAGEHRRRERVRSGGEAAAQRFARESSWGPGAHARDGGR